MKNIKYMGYGVLLVVFSIIVEKYVGYQSVNLVFNFVLAVLVLLFITSGVLISGDRLRANYKYEEAPSQIKRKIMMVMIPMILYILVYYLFLKV